MTEFVTGLAFGCLLGVIFAPLRLAGVDYSKWYRNPGEISERDDRSWIGLMKQTALYTGNPFLIVAVIVAIVAILLHCLANCLPSWLQFRALLSVVDWLGSWAFVGLLIGIVVVQGAVEALWRFGLWLGTGESLQIRLARPLAAAPGILAAAQAPVAGRRRLIICCDGTWNSPVQKRETNVVQLLRAIKPVGTVDGTPNGQPISQIVHYHLGVGTGNFVDRFLGGGTGVGLSSSVKACYGFLVDNYRNGDEILLFGFSRGAYVVRSVAGMIGVVGLLQKGEMFRFVEAWDYYALPEPERNSAVLDQIAPQRHRPVEVRCVGVWDTVGALGIPGTRLFSSAYRFHETSLGRHVRYAFQALAFDERRGNFQPAIWVKRYDDPHQTLEQVWFPGVHSDIGGGYQEHGLSDASLLWMLSRLQALRLVDIEEQSIADAVNRYHAERYAEGKLHDSRSYFWKAIACPIPRPVGITSESERIHISAFNRTALAHRGDTYASRDRRDWLDTIPPASVAHRGPLEQRLAFQRDGCGEVVATIVRPTRGFGDRVLRWLFGQA